ncbi:MAG: polyprenyl synthetase family protein [bacterium]|nr:polyprenyl synthetase family protein [Bacillota bacterium]
MNLHNYLQEKAASIEDALDRILAEGDTEPSILNEAMRYSVFAGGKRLRPILTIAAAEAVGGREEDVMTAACAIELIHTYSLIHDDLPAMDDDDYRRGRPTNHKVYGEALAILAGDALLTKAFEILAGCSVPGTAGRLMLRVIGEIAEAAGARGMVGGQTLDILSEGKAVDARTLFYIHKNKTGALLRASVRTGAILAGAGEEELTALTSFAEEFGLLFQITDDILNVVGDSSKMGKPVGTDAQRAKATYPALYGLDGARKMAREGKERALAALDSFDSKADPLRLLVSYLLEREK